LLHFLPAGLAYAMYSRFFIMTATQKLAVFHAQGKGWETESKINLLLICASGIIYIIWSLVLLRRHRKNILEQFSDVEKINLNWLRYLILGMSSIWLLVLYGNDQLIYGSVVVFVAFVGYYGIKQVGIFTYHNAYAKAGHTSPNPEGSSDHNSKTHTEPEAELDTNTELTDASNIQDSFGEEQASDSGTEANNAVAETKKKYQKSGLSDSDASGIHQKLREQMSSEKTFKDPELTLVELSQRLKVHPNILSQVINSLEHKNFYDYINDQRVEEFKAIAGLPQNQKYTLLALALECGFNSKTTFNRHFKKSTGLSPSDYLKSIRVSLKE
jgi:AraC-like DNA-binding protein